MKWYFASRTKHQSMIADITRSLQSKGETVMSEWVFAFPQKPFHEHLAETHAMAGGVIDSILQTDIFVLISDAEGTDMFIELGAAIAEQKRRPDMRIYIVGEHNKRSLMQLYPTIIHVDHMENVFEKEGINL